MGSFDGQKWIVYLNEEARERRDEILDHLQGNYDGPSEFVREKLEQETALDIDERIKRAESKEKEAKEKRERLERIKREREEQSQLRDKKELLQEKQDRLQKIQSCDKTEDAVREEVKDKILENKPPRFSDKEYLEKTSDRIERMIEQRLESGSDVDKLVKDVERLQSEIRGLNGGEDLDCFLDLRTEEVEAL
jgi:DNA repair exonuclease SbcCD ATPase subunit